jgi:predicted SprT family Zn-dependent metalloprotease
VRVEDAAKLARELMSRFRLVGWKFRFDRERRAFGTCSYQLKTIRLSLPLVELNPEDEVRDTILHEIAHALVGPGHNHDDIWKAKCRQIGARPEATYDAEDVRPVPLKYVSQVGLLQLE